MFSLIIVAFYTKKTPAINQLFLTKLLRYFSKQKTQCPILEPGFKHSATLMLEVMYAKTTALLVNIFGPLNDLIIFQTKITALIDEFSCST